MSISFNCLFLVFIIYHYLVYFLRKEKKSNLFTFLSFSCVVCACVSQRDLCRKKCEKKGDGIPCMFSFLFMCLWLSISLSTFSSFFLWVAAVFQTVFSVFFYAATIAAAAAVFLYLFIKRLCVCVSFYYLLCVCVRACSSLILFCCSLFLFFVY